jgi:hypothetical protein
MESKTIMKRNLQFYKPPNCKYECIAFILLNEEYIYNAYMNKLCAMPLEVSNERGHIIEILIGGLRGV